MGFFKDLKEDLSQAVNELIPEDELLGADEYVDNLDDELLGLDDIKKDSTDKEKTENLLSDTSDIDFDAILKSADESVVNTLGDELSSTLEASAASGMAEQEKNQMVENDYNENLLPESRTEESDESDEEPVEDLTQEPEEIIDDPVIDELEEPSGFSLENSDTDDLSDLIKEFESQIMTDEAEDEMQDNLSDNLDMESLMNSVMENPIESQPQEEELQDDFVPELKLEEDDPVLEDFEPEIQDVPEISDEEDMLNVDETLTETLDETKDQEESLDENMTEDMKDDDVLIEEADPEMNFNENEINQQMEEENMANLDESLDQNMNLDDENVDMDLIAQMLNDGDENEAEAPFVLPDEEQDEKVESAEPEAVMPEQEEISEQIPTDVSNEVTVITKGTKIEGNIISDSSLEIMGTVKGDIECLGKLSVTGHVEGNSKASEIFVNTTKLHGNLVSKGTVKLGAGTVVLGDIEATSAVIAGAVKGEIDVNGPIVVDSTAIVKGNIKAKSVQVNNGAVIDGYCSLAYAAVDIDNFFDGENEEE